MTQSQRQTARVDTSNVAVLTGDMVKSSNLSASELDHAMEALREGAEALRGWSGVDGAPGGHFSRFRGDGWQCAAPPVLALRACLCLRARLRRLGRKFETRISVGIGPRSRDGSDAVTGALDGAAFTLSGHGLDDMTRSRLLVIAWHEPPAGAALIDAVFALTDEISREWTPRQAEFLLESLSPGEEAQEVLAERSGISQQAVAKHLRAGGDRALRLALDAVEGAA